MYRLLFLSFATLIALAVGTAATLFPAALLESKGVAPTAASCLWMREVGVMLLAMGVVFVRVRTHPDSPTVRALMAGNLLIQLGLLGIEVAGYANGVITLLSGILPNAVLHVVLALGFGWLWLAPPTPQR